MKKNTYEYQATIFRQFEVTAQKLPNNIALVGERKQLTYSELYDSVISLTSHLDVESGFIYLLFEHDISMIIAMLSALRMTKAYIPLDPEHPIDRSEYIIHDSKGSVILTNNQNVKLANQLANTADNEIKIVNIDTIKESADAISPKIGKGTDLAYVLYTSGSTGKPKGVIQNNENVLYYISNYSKNLMITENDRLTLFSTYSFDASVMGIYGALLNGAMLYPYKIKKAGAIDNLKHWIYDNKITIYHSVPTLFRYFASKIENDMHLLSNVRLVVMGGEATLVNDVELYKKCFPDNCIFINGLGPTESTVTLQYFIDKNTEINTATVPVGTPIKDMNVYLLDEDNNEVGINEIGELVYSNKHLALGYLNRQEETDKAFIVDPIKKQGRAFKTGDLAKRNEDGLIEFQGRNDFQIKIRGYRIELNEIESVLDRHPSISKSIIMPLKTDKSEPQIIAYYSLIGKEKVSESNLKKHLKESLPEYMIPSYFYHLEELPLTPTGKVDRKFVVDNFTPNTDNMSENLYLAPRDKFEKDIFSIWERNLDTNEFGVNTEFTHVGGDSLMATSVALEIEELYNVEIELSALYKLGTIEELANYLKELVSGKESSTLQNSILIKHGNIEGENLFLIHAGNGEIQNYIHFCNRLSPSITCWAIRANRFNNYYPSNETLEEVASRYTDIIHSIQPKGPYSIVGWCFGGLRAYEIARQLESSGETVQFLGLINSHIPYSTTEEKEDMVTKYSLLDFKDDEKSYFSLGSEEKLIKKWLNASGVKLDLDYKTENVWVEFINNLEKHEKLDVIMDVIGKDLPDDRKAAIPFYENITLEKLIYYLAVLRSDANSQAYYYPEAKINSDIIFFSASDSQVDNRFEWKKHSEGKTLFIEVEGTHFSIYDVDKVDRLSRAFEYCYSRAMLSKKG